MRAGYITILLLLVLYNAAFFFRENSANRMKWNLKVIQGVQYYIAQQSAGAVICTWWGFIIDIFQTQTKQCCDWALGTVLFYSNFYQYIYLKEIRIFMQLSGVQCTLCMTPRSQNQIVAGPLFLLKGQSSISVLWKNTSIMHEEEILNIKSES